MLKPVVSTQHIGQALYLKGSNMKEDLSGPDSS